MDAAAGSITPPTVAAAASPRAPDLLAGREAVLLDLDGTLVTYGPGSADVWPDVFAMACESGFSRDQITDAFAAIQKPIWRDADRQRAYRVNMRAAWHHIMSEAMRLLGVPFDQARLASMIEAFAHRLVATVVCLPGTREALAELRRRGLRLALITNGDAKIQRAKLAQCELAQTFDVVVVEGEFGAGKPDPDVYLNALRQLGCPPDRALMIGDNLEFDVLGPMRVGIAGVWLSARGRSLPPGCDPVPSGIVRTLGELFAPSMPTQD